MQWLPSHAEVALAGLCGVVASSFTAPGSGSPAPVEVAPAGLSRVVASFFSAPGSGSPAPVEVAPAGLCRVVEPILHGPRQWLPGPCGGCPRRPLSRRRTNSSRPQAVAPRPLWRLPPPASVASSNQFFTAPGSGSPAPVEVAPAGLCRVVEPILHGPRQWLPVPCGGCPRRPLSRRRLLLLGPR